MNNTHQSDPRSAYAYQERRTPLVNHEAVGNESNPSISGGFMDHNFDGQLRGNIRTTTDGRVVIEQSEGSAVLPADQIPTIIHELNVCYDYCAAWKLREKE
jgi:hypothetical protein